MNFLTSNDNLSTIDLFSLDEIQPVDSLHTERDESFHPLHLHFELNIPDISISTEGEDDDGDDDQYWENLFSKCGEDDDNCLSLILSSPLDEDDDGMRPHCSLPMSTTNEKKNHMNTIPTIIPPASTKAVTETTPKTPRTIELELQVQSSMRKLANSMRRSDTSRSIVKRQRPNESEKNFFTSIRCQHLEQSRQRFWSTVIQTENLFVQTGCDCVVNKSRPTGRKGRKAIFLESVAGLA